MQQPVTDEPDGQASQQRLGAFLNGFFHRKIISDILALIKVFLGLALLIISIRGIKWDNLVASIHSVDLVWIAVAVSLVILGISLKFLRWRLFIQNYHLPSSNSKLFSAYFVGQAVNIIMPFRSGELVRLGYFSREPQVIPAIASTIVIEKYLDLLALTGCALFVSIKFSVDNIFNLRGLFLPVSVFLTLLIAAIVLLGPAAWQRIRSAKLLPKPMIDWLDHWIQASLWLRDPKLVIPCIFVTIHIWVIMWLTNLVLFTSFGLPLGGTAAGLVLIMVYVGLLPALMPGNIGPFYFFSSLALVPFGIAHDHAFTYAVILHAIVTIPPMLAGMVGLSLPSDRVVAS